MGLIKRLTPVPSLRTPPEEWIYVDLEKDDTTEEYKINNTEIADDPHRAVVFEAQLLKYAYETIIDKYGLFFALNNISIEEIKEKPISYWLRPQVYSRKFKKQ